jgi:U3 small nucleolar RNA-associated protein 3
MLAQLAPELPGLLEEFEASLLTVTDQLSPLLEGVADLRKSNKTLAAFVELKHNLLLSYCTYLSFYLLLKLQGADVKSHPVLFKITSLKQTLDGLLPLDNKLEKLLHKKLQGKLGDLA